MIIDWSLTKNHTHTHTLKHGNRGQPSKQQKRSSPKFRWNTSLTPGCISGRVTSRWIGSPRRVARWYSLIFFARTTGKEMGINMSHVQVIYVCMWQIDLCYSVQAKYRTISQSYTVHGHFNILNSLFGKGLYWPYQFSRTSGSFPPSTPQS